MDPVRERALDAVLKLYGGVGAITIDVDFMLADAAKIEAYLRGGNGPAGVGVCDHVLVSHPLGGSHCAVCGEQQH
jgi:hypothetical protein